MKRVFCALLLFFCISSLLAEINVTNVTAKSHWPWDGKIDITYSLEGDAGAAAEVSFRGYDKVLQKELPAITLEGNGVDELLPVGGPYKTTWDFGADYPQGHHSDMIVRVTEEKKIDPMPYLVVNLETGASRYTGIAPDLSDDTCRTTELWLRRISAGTFIMGSPEDEVGHYDNEIQHYVTLTQDYYIGVFEMTQKQYELIYGSNPSRYKGDCRPVDSVSYNRIRGMEGTAWVGWPMYGHAVDEGSFLGKLRAKTGLIFDLPTEAQWEYACRAGTSTALNTGRNLTYTGRDSAMDEAGRYEGNCFKGKGGYFDAHTKVGSYLPNAWGLYDMHGNVYEWCLDWVGYYPSCAVTDPMGAQVGFPRVIRGGSWDSQAQNCLSVLRGDCDPSCEGYNIGFRVVCLLFLSPTMHKLSVDGVEKVWMEGNKVTVTAPLKEGYAFKEWSVEGVILDDKRFATVTFPMPANDVTLTANYVKIGSGTTYLVVDLSTGNSRYTDTAPNLSDDTCRTTELWLRRIPKGTFIMGSPEDEVGRESDETQHQVTLTQDYYIGVFEMTQKQYELIYGSNPSRYKGDCRPVDSVSYNTIRGTGGTAGAGWPAYGHAVDEDSFLEKLRAKTGLLFDLPTEAQWEYACRAGTATALNTGKNLTSIGQDPAMDMVGRYNYNRQDSKGGYSEHTKVGSYLSNAWGLYDMHGNMYEWCLDWYGGYPSGIVTDPVGAQSGSNRVERGGNCYSSATRCRSANNDSSEPSHVSYHGFRVVCLPQ